MDRFSATLLAGAACAAVCAPAMAQTQEPSQSLGKVGALEQQSRSAEQQLAAIEAVQNRDASSAAAIDPSGGPSNDYKDSNGRLNSQPSVTLDDGNFTVVSPSGAFSLSLKSLVQFDYGYFAQGEHPSSVDLNSGSNFRRAQIGVAGTAWRDWSYNFTYDFGGNGVEKNGYIYYAYIEYTGLAPFHARVGAMTPFLGMEDSTGSGDLLFLERASAQDVSRNIAGGPGREGIDLFGQGNNYLLSVSYTGKKTGDAATFGAQEALVGRASWLAVSQQDFKLLLDAGGTYLFKLAQAAPNTYTSNFLSLSNGTELAVDSTKTVNTGNIDASKANQYELESALEYDGLYAQGGWDHYQIIRRTDLPNPSFSGWYAQASYSLTGETHGYDPTTASFRNLQPANPLESGGWGAWEIAARYSNIDLDYQPLKSTAVGGVPGGNQNVWTIGLNWYPTNGLKFQLDYFNIRVSHANAPANDISADAVGIRSQLSF